MRIAVTGASGFVGSRVVAALRARGHALVTLDRSRVGDIAAVSDWSSRVAGMDAVVHLAALAHARGVDEARLRAVNVDATIAIGKASARAGVRMLLMSTVKVLGEETHAAAFDEASPLAPQDAYARAKADAESGLRRIPGLALTVLRPPMVYGAEARANFRLLLRAVERGWPLPFAAIDNRRSLIGAGNLADAVVRCLEAPQAVGRCYGVSDGAPWSTPELCRAIGAAMGRPARLFALPPVLLELAPPLRKLTRSLVLDDGAIRRELGWSPPLEFAAGLRG